MDFSPSAYAAAYGHLMANYKFQTSNYALYIFDHILTFSDEVEKIWSQPLTFATMLFYINRYVTHFQFIIFNVAYYETSWPLSVCDHYVAFDGAATLALVTVAETILILRVYALYQANKYILICLFSLVAGQIIVSAWGIHFGRRVPQPDGFPGCVLTGKNNWIAALWGAPMVTDSCIFGLTLWKAIRYRKDYGAGGPLTTVQIILRDGIMYYFVIFGANFMNMLIYLLAVEDLKAVGAGVSQILTAIMITRLQLNLRRARPSGSARAVDTPMKFNKQHDSSTFVLSSTGTFFTIGNLGEDIEGPLFEDSSTNNEDSVDFELQKMEGSNEDGVRVESLEDR